MAHECINCGCDCHCNGDIDDCVVSTTPNSCRGCGCENDYEEDFDDDFDDDEFEFIPCPRCDGHPACEDFGCAYENGCGHLVQREPGNDFDW